MSTVGRDFRTRFRSRTWVRRNVVFEKKIIFNKISSNLKRNLVFIRSSSSRLSVFLFWTTSPYAIHDYRAYILCSCITFSTLIKRVILRSICSLVRLVLFENLIASFVICRSSGVCELGRLVYYVVVSLLAVANCLIKLAIVFSMMVVVLMMSRGFLRSSSFFHLLTDQCNIINEVLNVILLRYLSLRLRDLDVKDLIIHWVGLPVAWVIFGWFNLCDIEWSVWINTLVSTRVVIWNHLLLPWIFLLCLVKVVNYCSSINLWLILHFQLRHIWTLRSGMMSVALSLHILRLYHFIFLFLRSSFTWFCISFLISLPPSVSRGDIRGIHRLFSSMLLND